MRFFDMYIWCTYVVSTRERTAIEIPIYISSSVLDKDFLFQKNVFSIWKYIRVLNYDTYR